MVPVRCRRGGGGSDWKGNTYHGRLAVLIMLDPDGVHTERNLLPLHPDLDDPLPQLQLLLLCLADALLQRKQGIKCNCVLQKTGSQLLPESLQGLHLRPQLPFHGSTVGVAEGLPKAL